MEGGNIKAVLTEMKQMIQTPVKAYMPKADSTEDSSGEDQFLVWEKKGPIFSKQS